ncbi:MAG: serine hydrolase domain-containing protein, partial [Aquabacterium sp.]
MAPATAEAAAQTAQPLSAAALQALRERLTHEVEAGRLPGAVVALWLDGQPAYECAVGWLDRAAAIPMRADALFRIYSMTKPLASVAAMLLVQDGRLALHDDVADCLPGWPRRGTKVLDLLMHTSGLIYGQRQPPGDLRSAYQRLGLRLNPRGMPGEHFLRDLAQMPLAAAPGTHWQYGHSTDLLGVVIEAVSGQRLGHFLRERLFAPLAMHDTGFAVAPHDAQRLAQPLAHDPADGSALNVPDQTFDPTAPALMDSAGAGALSTAADYGRFANFLLAGGRRADGQVLLRAELLAEMMRDHLA